MGQVCIANSFGYFSQMILNETTSTIGVLLRNIFQEMLKISTEPLSISSQRVITDACGIKMSRTIHQDTDEFIKTLLRKLMDDDGIGKQVRDIFQIGCINFKSLFGMQSNAR